MAKNRSGVIVASLLLAASSGGVLGLTQSAASAKAHQILTPAAIVVRQQWSTQIAGPAGGISTSSPNVANLPGGPAVVVGDDAGYVDAYYLSNGAQVPGWPYNAGSAVGSTPSVAVTQAGGLESVYVGVGNVPNPYIGGYQAISPQGGDQWFVPANNPKTDPYPINGVKASLAVGTLQGQTAVVGGSMGQSFNAINAGSGAILGGFPWFPGDSSFATPALGDLYGNGQTDIIEGNDATTGYAYDTQYTDGGSLRVVSQNGNTGQQWPNGGLICQYNTNQVVQASPAVGNFLANGSATGIVVGFGQFYPGVSNTNQLIAVDSNCNLQWTATLDANTVSSPVLANVLGNGQLQVIENTGSTIYALNGNNGQVIWSQPISSLGGSPVTADLSGAGYQDIIVPTYGGAEILDGKTGQVVQSLSGAGIGGANSALVTDDANGTIGITLAGGSSITHYEVPGSNGSLADEAGAWPVFHHDSQLTGDAPKVLPNLQVPCSAPSGGAQGYDMTASDGGIFTFGNLPFCGSTGAITLNQPIVGMALTNDAGGYWTVARDGGLFAFGDAHFFGSMGGKPLNEPIVGMAATHDGGGYWEVASDGGLFAFGDANFYGSMGGKPLNAPIVSISATPDGGGYWEVASDGGIFAFGDARFQGSMGGQPLNQPIVGIASVPMGGYFEVARDGGLFAFGPGATFYGSMGGQSLNQPVVGLAATVDGHGYWEVAADGGMFAFGDAQYYGSMGGKPLNKPIVALAAA